MTSGRDPPEAVRSGGLVFAFSFLMARFLIVRLLPIFVWWLLCCEPPPISAQQSIVGNEIGLNGLREIPFSALSSPYITPLGQAALSIRPTEWKHAETDNFVYHFFHGFIATPVSMEAEFYYRVVARDLDKDTSHWERKAHIFIFESPEDWRAFQTKASLDPWTGGIHQGGSLFIQRDPNLKFKGNTLGHETAHLVVDRFFGSNVPLWLNEGYAEYISRVAYASYNRARGYSAHPTTNPLTAESFIPLERLSNALSYPADTREVIAFYTESEKLVRFLSAADKTKFQAMFTALARGSLFENALHGAFGTLYPTPHLLEEAFKPYAVQPAMAAVPSPQK